MTDPEPPRSVSPTGERRTPRWILPVILVAILGTAAVVGPPFYDWLYYVEVWHQESTVVDPADHSFTDERGALGPITGWRQVERFSGERTGLERWWYDENGILARERSVAEVTTYYDRSGETFLQSTVSHVTIPGSAFESHSIQFRVKGPWQEPVTSSPTPTAPWTRAGISAAQWFESIEPKQ